MAALHFFDDCSVAHRVGSLSSVENWPVVLEDLPSPANSEGFSSPSQNLSFNMSGPVLRILQGWWLSVALRAEREVANPKWPVLTLQDLAPLFYYYDDY